MDYSAGTRGIHVKPLKITILCIFSVSSSDAQKAKLPVMNIQHAKFTSCWFFGYSNWIFWFVRLCKSIILKQICMLRFFVFSIMAAKKSIVERCKHVKSQANTVYFKLGTLRRVSTYVQHVWGRKGHVTAEAGNTVGTDGAPPQVPPKLCGGRLRGWVGSAVGQREAGGWTQKK